MAHTATPVRRMTVLSVRDISPGAAPHPDVIAAQARARVGEGAAFLDEKQPGWVHAIDVDTLNLASPFHCVLGQLHGSYNAGRWVHGLTWHRGAELGFEVDRLTTYASLDEAWREAIAERLN